MKTPWNTIVAQGHRAVLLIRHGRTSWNAERRFLGRTDIGLDAEGRREAHALSQAWGFRPVRIYSSRLTRARETAAILHQDVTLVSGLEELDQGALEGLTAPEALGRFPSFFEDWARDPSEVVVPGGERLCDLQARAMAAVDRIVREPEQERIVPIVTHQLVIAAVTCQISGRPLSAWRECAVRNAAITILCWDGTSYQVAAMDWVPSPDDERGRK